MESRLRETSRILMKSLENWYPFLKGIEESVSLLEADIENLMKRKKALEKEIEEQIKNSNAVCELDKQKSLKHLADAELYLKNATEVYLELYKAKVGRVVPPESYAEKLIEKGREVGKVIREKKETLTA